MQIRNDLKALIAFVECDQPSRSKFFGLVAAELENVTDEQLDYYIENDLDLWGIVNLLVMNSIELNIQCSTSFLEQTLLLARQDYFKKESETAH